MILYYAVGGGLGHLTRARRVLEVLGLTSGAAIVTASPYARDGRVSGGIPVVEVPPHCEHDFVAHRAWLRTLSAERLIVDTFPAGIQGELCGLDVPMDLVARLLRWNEYVRAVEGEFPAFDVAYVVEELTPEHDRFVRAHSRRAVSLDLTPPACIAAEEDFWVVVHSGPEEEVRELVDYAAELRALAALPPSRVVVATRCAVALPDGFESVDAYPAAPLFARASRIISAAGFNVMLETAPWRHKHEVVPFARRFDDQFLRAARRRTDLPGTAGS